MRFLALLLSLVVPATISQGNRPKLPPQVKIGPYVYKVIYKHHDNQVGGIFFDTAEIHIEPGLPLNNEREVLLHEIFHGCAHYFSRVNEYYHDDNKGPLLLSEDQFIEATAPMFTLVIRDNPNLIEYLSDVQVTGPSRVLQP